jgi:hypothetical protein
VRHPLSFSFLPLYLLKVSAGVPFGWLAQQGFINVWRIGEQERQQLLGVLRNDPQTTQLK